MKRAALGALLISLVAGSTAMAGTGVAYRLGDGHRDDPRNEPHRPDNRPSFGNSNPDRHDPPRHDDHRGNDHRGNDWNNGRRDDHRSNRDDPRWNDDHRNDRRWDDPRGNDRKWDDHRGGNRGWDDHRGDNRGWDDHRWNGRPDDRRWNDRGRYDRRWENGRWHWGSYYRPHGYSVRHWSRGDRLPYGYYQPTYIIDDYYDCGLRPPPYGYHWVRVDHDAVLAVIATGVVLDVIYNQFW